MLFFLQNSFLAILMLISQKPSKEEEWVKNKVFSLLASRHQKVNRMIIHGKVL